MDTYYNTEIPSIPNSLKESFAVVKHELVMVGNDLNITIIPVDIFDSYDEAITCIKDIRDGETAYSIMKSFR